MSRISYSQKTAKDIFVMVSSRGSFSRDSLGYSWIRSIDDAYRASGMSEAIRVQKQINARSNKDKVTIKPVTEFMKLHWGIDFHNKGQVVVAQRYYCLDEEVISEEPPTDPDYWKYVSTNGRAYATPELAWKYLRAKNLRDLEYHQGHVFEINKTLEACRKALEQTNDDTNIVMMRREDD